MSFTHNVLRTFGLLAGLILCTSSAQAASWQAFGGTLSGDWTDVNHWSTGDAPDTVGETATLSGVINTPPGPHTITLTDVMYPAGLTTGNVSFSNAGANVTNARFIVINASGTGSTLNWNIGSVATPGNLGLASYSMALDNVNMNILGTASGAALNLNGYANALSAPVTQDWVLDATNSTINITSAPTPNQTIPNISNVLGVAITDASMRMNGGSLTVTNAGNTGLIQLSMASPATTRKTVFDLTGTVLTTNNMYIANTSIFNFDGTGAFGPSSISGALTVATGTANLNGGTLNMGALNIAIPATNYTATVNVTGGTVNVTGEIAVKSTSGNPTGAFPDTLNISGGSVTAATMDVGGTSFDKGAFAVQISNTGSLAVSGTLVLGFDDFSTRHGAGTLGMTGGTLSAATLKVGAAIGASPNSLGYYDQTGGTSTFGSVVLSRDNTTPSGYGTQQFVVGSGATMNITGPGFTQVGTGDWHVDDTPGNLDFSGKLVFNPSSAITQTLLAFGEDQGAYELFTGQLTPAILDNYGVGTLDLSNLNGTEKLFVSAAGNFTTNALYVNKLVGLSSANATTLLDSPINIFYNTAYSPLLLGMTYDLTSGGQLIPLTEANPAPEPSSLLLLALGSVALLRRSRRRMIHAN